MDRRRSPPHSTGNKGMKNKNPRIPEQLIQEILMRSRAKSLVRFKCVCKSWLSLISDPSFAKSHYDLTAVKNEKLIIRMSIGYGPNSNKVEIVALDLEKETLKKHSVELVCPILTYHCPTEIRNDCRGFILLECSIPVRLFVWNPTTGAVKAITQSPIMDQTLDLIEHDFEISSCRTYRRLVYDTLRDDYLVIQAWIDDIYDPGFDDALPCLIHCFEFFSMRTNSWTKLGAISLPCGKLNPQFLFLNGVIHWLAVSDDGKLVRGITAFDLTERKVYEIPVPHDGLLYENLKLGVIGGCLCLWNSPMEQLGTIERWVMKEYNMKSSWTKSNHVLAYAISHHLSILGHFTKSGFVGFEGPNKIVKLNDKGKLLCSYRDDYPLSIHKFRNYTESLLSLPCECSQAGENYY